MPWSIRWTEQGIRDLARLDPPVARRIIAKLERAAQDPLRFFTRLAGSDDYKLRIGDDRLLALLSHEARTIDVERVDHRSRVYRKKGYAGSGASPKGTTRNPPPKRPRARRRRPHA